MHPSVPMATGLTVAFFKGNRPGIEGIFNRIGRHLDAGPYSHAEIILPNGLSYSSSIVDKGVRFKNIGYSSVGNWDFLPIPNPDLIISNQVATWFAKHHGELYDHLGNLRFATNFAHDDPTKWFCSEAIMASLGVPEAFRYGPSGAASTLAWKFNTNMIFVHKPF